MDEPVGGLHDVGGRPADGLPALAGELHEAPELRHVALEGGLGAVGGLASGWGVSRIGVWRSLIGGMTIIGLSSIAGAFATDGLAVDTWNGWTEGYAVPPSEEDRDVHLDWLRATVTALSRQWAVTGV